MHQGNTRQGSLFSLFKRQSALALTFFGGLILSLLLFYLIVGTNTRELRREFRTSVFQHALLLSKEIQILQQFIADAQFFFSASQQVTEEEFGHFSSFVLTQEKVVFIAWIPTAEESSDLLAPAKARYMIAPEAAERILKAVEVNRAAREAIASSATRTSNAFSFMITTQDEPLIAIAAPTFTYLWPRREVAEGNLTGVLVAIIRLNPLINQLEEPQTALLENIFVYMTNPARPDKQDLVFQHAPSRERRSTGGTIAGLLTSRLPVKEEITLPLGSRELRFVFLPPPGYLSHAINWPAWMVLLLGLGLTAMVTALLRMFIARNQKVQQQVDERTLELRQSEARQKAILANIADGVLTMDKEGVIEMFNLACERMFGYREQEIAGGSIYSLIPNLDQFDRKELCARSASGVATEAMGRCANGTLFPLEVTFGKVQGTGDDYQLVCVVRDITIRKQNEEELKKSNEALDDFAYIVSHDLKEPLRCIQYFSSFLLEDCQELLNDECLEYAETMVRVSRRMQQQIDDLLKFSRASHKEVNLVEVDVRAIVEEVKDSLQTLVRETDAEVFTREPLPIIRYDRSCMVEIMTNLIQNALKYRKEDVKPVVEIGYTAQGEIYVKDNGIGIKPQHLEDIFKMFRRLHGENQYGGGTGSGLAIVKKLVERNGGEIYAQSEYGAGTVFYFSLPERPYPPEATPP